MSGGQKLVRPSSDGAHQTHLRVGPGRKQRELAADPDQHIDRVVMCIQFLIGKKKRKVARWRLRLKSVSNVFFPFLVSFPGALAGYESMVASKLLTDVRGDILDGFWQTDTACHEFQ